ncbi:hypothetical protein OROMI_001879 [Orobanche minor]
MAARYGVVGVDDLVGEGPWTAYVRGMAWTITEKSLREGFASFGEILEVSEIVYDAENETGAYGSVTFKDKGAMLRAIWYKNGLYFRGRRITVSREAYSGRREGGGGYYDGRPEFKLIHPGGGGSIAVSRAGLARHSRVFRGMMELGDEESINYLIKKDSKASYNTLRMFVDYLNTDEAPQHHQLDQETACDLLVLADIFMDGPFFSYCETFLQGILTWDNALQLFEFAHENNADSLKDDCLQLFSSDMAKLSERLSSLMLQEDLVHILDGNTM